MLNFKKIVALAVGVVLAGTVSASAAIYATGITYNTDNVAAQRGTANDRDNGNNALGNDLSTFFEIGLVGNVDFTFGQQFTGPGAVVEITNGSLSGWPEFAKVEVGYMGTFTEISNSPISNQVAGPIVLSFIGGPFDTLRFSTSAGTHVDTCGTAPNSYACGGFDIAAVSVSQIPLPAAAWLLIAGLGGLGVVARRRKTSDA